MDGRDCRKIERLFGFHRRPSFSLSLLVFILSLAVLTSPAWARNDPKLEVGNPEAYELYLVPSPAGPGESSEPQSSGAESTEPAMVSSRTAVPPGIPVTRNREVDHFIRYFQRSNLGFSSVLQRTGRYFEIMRMIFSEYNLPEDLVYLSVIESGLHADATSSSGAKGFWQFLKSTGRRYGLVINRWVDERRDPIKSTYAAARYLSDLYDKFQSWMLAQAGYNAGEQAVEQAVKRADSKDFWELARKRVLVRETRNFVPKLMAAVLIGKNPQEYGFDNVNYMSPLRFDEVHLHRQVDLRLLAKLARVPYRKLRELNPGLLGPYTPPHYPGGYQLRVPPETRENFIKPLKFLEGGRKARHRIHRVALGETLVGIAARYGVDVSSLSKLNRITDARRLQAGTELLIPME